MERKFLLVFWVLMSGVSFGQTVKIGDHLKIKFPSRPEIEKSGKMTFYVVSDPRYVVNVMIANMHDDPNFNIQQAELTEFYREVVDGTLKAGGDPKLVSEEAIHVGKYEGIEMRYTKDVDVMDDIAVTKRILLIEKSFYIFEVWDLSKKGQEDLERKLFESITLL